jgi:predicted kinase
VIYLMQGLPGSGKSRWVRDAIVGLPAGVRYEVCSADDYHMVDGEYKFDPARAGEAHDECYRKFLAVTSMSIACEPHVFVDNTNTTLMELSPYVRICEVYKLKYEIVRIECSLELAQQRNSHGVPTGTLLAMQRNLLTEVPPARWKLRLLSAKE